MSFWLPIMALSRMPSLGKYLWSTHHVRARYWGDSGE